MDPHVIHSVCELFVVLEGVASRLSEHLAALRPLTAAAEEGPLLLGVDAYYRQDTDVGLLAVRFDERSMSSSKRRWLLQLTADSNLPVLDPSRLDAEEQNGFYKSYLCRYSVRVDDQESPGAALEELGRLLGVSGRASDAKARRPSEPASVPLARMSSGSQAGPEPRPDATDAVPTAQDDHDYHTDRVLVDVEHPSRTPDPPRGKGRKSFDRSVTIPGRPLARATSPKHDIETLDPFADVRQAQASAPPRRHGSDSGSRQVYVRFQRGDRWVQARLRSLTPKSATLATGAPPPVGSHVRLAVGLADLGVILEGTVRDTSSLDDPTGSLGFRIEFATLEAETRGQLIGLLKRARKLGVSLKPPPQRRAARFPIAWPVVLTTESGRVRGSALDVSSSGLFLATGALLRQREVHFELPLDRRGPAVGARARIAREVTELMARSRGLDRGYGVEIVDIDVEGQTRFESFVDRVRRRSERHVIVAAQSSRLEELSRGLLAAGYAVTRAASATELVCRESFARPPDCAVLDVSLESDAVNRQRFERLFSQYRVPCVTTRGEAAHTARSAVDRLLAVAG